MPDLASPLWRLGYDADPLGFKPRELYGWTNRFDDRESGYRTIYLAEQRRTCVCELLQDLRPDARAIQEYRSIFPRGELPPTAVPGDWISRMVFVQTTTALDGYPSDLRDTAERARIEREHADLLVDHGLEHLNLSDLTSRNRAFTQGLSRCLYDDGCCGIVFPSNVGPGACLCLFEGRGELRASSAPEPLSASTPELAEICADWGLSIAR
jgi:hypothetical protein